MNLNYEEFKEKIKDDIKDYMDEKYKEHPEPVIPFPQLDKALVADILRRAAE